ncbi:uncharacterized protein [Macrobrachium rosenbergii]|uniref:uncharacterized protein isoform X2 n=1 Tax=Macrobrachium rosenbergii TaxID=79674 RepID=UPI0034D3F99E
MAKTKEGAVRANPTRKNNLNNNNNNDRNKKNLENGLYVHSSPPKAINSNNGQGSATIRDYIRAGDIDALEEVVLQGQGTKLVNQPATDQKVRNFLKTVPSYMSKIDLIHDAVEKGNLRDLKALLDRRKLARSKDAQGVGLLHKAVVHDHRGIVDYLISDYPETLDVTDHEGRTALHYCAASNFPDDMYSVLSDAVADPQLEDHNGKTAADYMSNPRELNISKKNNKKGSGGSKGKRMTPPKRKSPGHKIRTPPKREGMTITGANIRIWIHDKDLTQLEKIVWEGQGHRLLGETSNNAKVRQFLNLVPRMMTKIKEVHQAAINGDLETLDAKADPTDILIAKDQNGLTPLHKSAALGLKDVSEWIVQKNHSTLFAQDNKGRTPLFYAGIAKDGGEVYDMLLRSGADKNHNDQYRRTADYYRFKPTDLDVSIIHETPVAPRGGGGSTLDIPSRSSGHSKEGSRAPSRNGRSRNPSRRNSPGEDKKKNDKKNDKNIPQEKIAALHEAAATGNVTNVRRLVKENPKLAMARDKDGAVALHYAAKSGDPKVTKYVLSLYPEAVTLEDNEGRTPLHYAGMAHGAGADEVFTLLEKEGANPDDVDLDAIEELHSAVEEGESRKVMQLLDKKQKAQTRDRNQANILHKAVLHGHTDLVRYMISTFPELIKQEDRAGRTPLHYAAVLRDGGHIYKILEKAGGNPKAKDHSGHSPEDYKNDPKILTQWDLMKELEEGVGNTNAKGRPDTKGSEDEAEGSEQDPAAPISLEEEYEKFSNTESSSLLKKHLTPEIFADIKDRTTSLGATLYDCIKSGLANPDSHIGLYAPDAESYACFKELFDPVIDEYHGGFGPDNTHPTVDFGDPTALGDLNAWGDYVVSTRVRCARSVEGYPFNPLLTSEQYTGLEQNVGNALQTLEEDLAGNYRSLSEISPEDQEELLEKHLLFKQGDRFLEAAGACRFWPEGRGIFLNADNTLVIWVNEEDHLRIISMQEGGNLSEVYSRFVRAVTTLGEKLPFSSSEHLGFLSFCPTNLGTGIRASVHIRLPKLGEDMQTLEETANKYNLQVRGTSGEHSEAKGHVYDVSNRRRLGITEIEAIQEMYDGVKEIIQLEKSLEDSSNENTSNDTRADANMLSDRHKGMLSRRNSTVSSKSEFPGMWSDDGQYLTKVLGDALVRALSEVNEARPKDPISYLACSLYNYRYSEKPDSPTNDSKSIGSTGSGGSGHSTIAMQTVLDSTGGPQQTSPQTRDKNGQNVLHFAASRPHGRSAFYRLVAESGCNLADRDDQYRTPRDVAEDNDLQENVRAIDKWIINLAAEGKQKQLKKLLIDGYDHIADVDDDQGNNVLKVAQNKGQGKTVEFLRGLAAFEEKRDWLHKAIRVGSLPHVQYIADSEDIARAKDVHSRTSLHIATLCEEKEIMEFLATQYPDLLKIGDNLERTPLHYAMAVEGVDQVAKVLVQAGARRAVKDLRGRTPSGSFIHPEIVRELQKEERKLTDPTIKPIPEEEPGVPEGEPGVPEGEPGVPEGEPGVPEEEPGVPEEEPGVPEGEPGVPEEEPVVPEGEPGVLEEPGESEESNPVTTS